MIPDDTEIYHIASHTMTALMTLDNDDPHESAHAQDLTQPVIVYTGPKWLADIKQRFGAWLENRRT